MEAPGRPAPPRVATRGSCGAGATTASGHRETPAPEPKHCGVRPRGARPSAGGAGRAPRQGQRVWGSRGSEQSVSPAVFRGPSCTELCGLHQPPAGPHLAIALRRGPRPCAPSVLGRRQGSGRWPPTPSPGSGSSHVAWRGRRVWREQGSFPGFPGRAPGAPPACALLTWDPEAGHWLSRLLARASRGTDMAPRGRTGGGGGCSGDPHPLPGPRLSTCRVGPPEPAPAHAGRTAGVALSTAPRRGCGVTLLPVHTALFDYCFRLTAAHPSGRGGDRRLCLGNNSPPSRPGIEPQEICLKFNT